MLIESPAIVTGGASGLGWATARMLASHGAKVAIIDLDAELGAERAASIGGLFARSDVTDHAEIAAALSLAEQTHGIARVLVNCAGVGKPRKTVGSDGEPYPLDQFRRIVEINLIGTFNVASKFAARLAQASPDGEQRGVIVNTSSVAAFEGQIGQVAYAASKAGIVGMTLPLARDLARLAIRVVTIAPGIFHTPILDVLPPEAIAALGNQVPFPSRLGQPDEFAALVRAVVENPMLNGETIRLDGAIRMPPR